MHLNQAQCAGSRHRAIQTAAHRDRPWPSMRCGQLLTLSALTCTRCPQSVHRSQPHHGRPGAPYHTLTIPYPTLETASWTARRTSCGAGACGGGKMSASASAGAASVSLSAPPSAWGAGVRPASASTSRKRATVSGPTCGRPAELLLAEEGMRPLFIAILQTGVQKRSTGWYPNNDRRLLMRAITHTESSLNFNSLIAWHGSSFLV